MNLRSGVEPQRVHQNNTMLLLMDCTEEKQDWNCRFGERIRAL